MKTSKSKAKQPPDFAPGELADETSRIYFDLLATERTGKKRLLYAVVFLAGVIALQGGALFRLMPLKTIETIPVWKVEGGRVVTDGQAVASWAPDQEMIAYFVNSWAEAVFDINAATIEDTTRRAVEMTIGMATDQLRDLRQRDNPMVLLRDSPGLIRTYEYSSANFISDNVLLLRFKATTRRPNSTPQTVSYALTATFTRIKPTDRNTLMRNPAGLYIKSFSLSEESLK
ncbi:type IV secretion system protein [Noviherbaspirillum pedocola]|uniref:Type IV secretion system protein n=1 Tax=Noviherbaspirillum pedocola TaxID=2801341 RepID=A0A934W7V8_9BURK|nr:type IV secretion system protein [Noviherbaspirillum pedocola]MBK4736078.1 type IV secretion system protein [Noviherbaspirillum pedocola]